ncbi:MAG TPA: hypothetical protein VHM90_16045, partial [Phycisphaerae bacterium]|nr:hypothetical protein [Phycisphaerae bacterium]
GGGGGDGVAGEAPDVCDQEGAAGADHGAETEGAKSGIEGAIFEEVFEGGGDGVCPKGRW